jgi:hypothetical protein
MKALEECARLVLELTELEANGPCPIGQPALELKCSFLDTGEQRWEASCNATAELDYLEEGFPPSGSTPEAALDALRSFLLEELEARSE